jgi:acetyl esterase/lipase
MSFPRQIPNIPPRSAHHELHTDVVYAEAGGEPLRYDHYRPLGVSGPAPCVVFVHGGGWASGDPSQAAGNALHLARQGIATVALSYRLAPAHPFPAALDDVRTGLRWVRRHADELGVDPHRLALLGLSAGAHLVMLAHLGRALPALDPTLPPALASELENVSEDVRCVVAHYGPFDLARRRSPMIDTFLGPRADDPATARLASPVLHAAAATAPILLIHGTGDTVVSWKESQRMHDALLAAGRDSELLLLDGAPHAFQMDWRGEANQRANAAMDAFLARHLVGERSVAAAS